VNTSRTNVILGKTCLKIHGAEAIVERILGLDFEISPLSFFQVHPWQTEVLYQTAIDFCHLAAEDTVVDAYAGAGTIALCMAAKAKSVIGIEIVPQAVQSAERNALRNRITNAQFHTAAVESLLPKLVAEGLRPDVIVLDPPRKGVEPAVIEAVLKASPRRVVYVSCHVPTQARDMALLAAGGYRFEKCQPVDMFCYAGGVENVAAMVRGQE
jgi:23S rRNA (uracil1939-C5)-methyltransferase